MLLVFQSSSEFKNLIHNGNFYLVPNFQSSSEFKHLWRGWINLNILKTFNPLLSLSQVHRFFWYVKYIFFQSSSEFKKRPKGLLMECCLVFQSSSEFKLNLRMQE